MPPSQREYRKYAEMMPPGEREYRKNAEMMPAAAREYRKNAEMMPAAAREYRKNAEIMPPSDLPGTLVAETSWQGDFSFLEGCSETSTFKLIFCLNRAFLVSRRLETVLGPRQADAKTAGVP